MGCIVSLARVIASLPVRGSKFSSNFYKNAALLRLATFHFRVPMVLAVGIKFVPSVTRKLMVVVVTSNVVFKNFPFRYFSGRFFSYQSDIWRGILASWSPKSWSIASIYHHKTQSCYHVQNALFSSPIQQP